MEFNKQPYDHNRQSTGFLMENWIRFSLFLILCISAAISFGTREAEAVDDLIVYDDSLASGWQNWSYNERTINLAATSPTHSAPHSIAVSYTGGWSGFMIGFGGTHLDVNAYDTFQFRIHGGTTGGQSIRCTLAFNSGNVVQTISPQAGAWTLVEIPLAGQSPRDLYSIDLFNNTAGAQSTYYLDDMSLSDSGEPPPPPPPPGAGPDLNVDAADSVHPISPYIYGMNFASEEVAHAVRLPVRRWGGNSTTRFNWQIDVHNTGSDWYFENIPDAPGTIYNTVNQDLNTGSKTILTMPLLGWIPKRRQPNHPFDCGFKVSVYGTQDSVDPWDTDCGNGEQGGVPITGNDPTDTSQAITPTFVTDWIDNLTQNFGAASANGVMFYNLDNEPIAWSHTHRDVYPAAVTYDEIRDRTYTYGAAIKGADPSALTLGPVTWSWCAYFYSAADGCSAGSDRMAHGNMDFTPWDRSYVQESWISQPVYLIPRMKKWVADHYPGTKLAITEYNWGALGYMNGALAQADILGIFGREGLDMATLWSPPDITDPGTFAFRMYRNYDGTGQGFGDTSISAVSADQDGVAIYAAIRSDDGALTAMLINKTGDQLQCSVSLSNFQSAGRAEVYRYSSADLTAIAQLLNISLEPGRFTADLPANSITLVVIPPGLQSECLADTEPDGDVDDEDLEVLSNSFGQAAVVDDIDGDDDMDGEDLYKMAVDFNRTDCFP